MSKISLSDLSKIGIKRILDYREISERYPYCACSKVLYLLSLKKLDDPDFNKILSQTAICVPNRKYLATLIEKFAPDSGARDGIERGDLGVRGITATATNPATGTISDIIFGRQRHTPVTTFSATTATKFADLRQTAPHINAKTVSQHPVTPTAVRTYVAEQTIDNFLNNPQDHKPIKVDANKDYSQIKIGENSIKEDLSFGTEAIAKLYAEQGNPKKAIEIYHNLMEKNPEKALYYGSLIRKLRV